jgi:sugar lactone lactonase YvrE
MIIRNYPALQAFALCALLVPAAGSARGAAHGHGTFPSFIPFDASKAEFPEGVAVDKVGNVYVSIRQVPTGPVAGLSDQIWKFSPSGAKTVLADFGSPGGGAAGLAVDAEGNVYMARTASAAPHNGVYKVDKHGKITLLPGTGQIIFPDGLAFDQQGNLYITEVFSIDPVNGAFAQGGIWRVPKGGTAEPWLRHDLLTGLTPTLFPFPIGANGIGFCRGSLYVINTDKALVVRIPMRPDGCPGEPENWKQVQDVPESVFYQSQDFPAMLDGLSLDVHGNVYVAVPSRLAVVRINAADRSQETIAVYPQAPMDACYSLAFGTGKGEQENLFVTNSGLVGVLVPSPFWAGPGLVKIEVGIPGLPLP